MKLTLLKHCLITLVCNIFVEGCFRTGRQSGGEIPVETCETCSANSIDLIAGNNADSVTPVLSEVIVNNEGCLTAVITCDVSDIPDALTYMTFQSGQAGSLGDPDTLITADLFCID
ncbi:hypothetical protein FO519_009281, partial [Halicephalobus sp. NKZ332]